MTDTYLNMNERGGTGPNGLTSYTIDEAAAQLTRSATSWGADWGSPATVSYAYRASAPSSMPEDTAGFSRFSTAQINATELALQSWSDVANVTFVRAGSGNSGSGAYSNSATILFGNYSSGMDGAAAFTYFPGSTAYSSFDGDVWVNSSLSYNANPVLNDYGQLVLVHEIGHSIGLDHPGDYNAGPNVTITYDTDAAYFEDSMQYSVMSYFTENHTGGDFGIYYPATIMLDDIAAAQRLYGANMSTRIGDTVYGFHSNSGRAWFTANSASNPLIFAVWDAGGSDTFDFSGYASNQKIDLGQGNFSNVGGLIGNVAIAKGVTIENAIGGSGADAIIGNASANHLQGNGGNDTLTGGAGADLFVVTTGGGADVITDFAVGADKIDATAYGAYQSIAQSGSDTVITFAPGVTETLKNVTASMVTTDSFVGLNAAPPPPGGQTINGTGASETLSGGSGNDILYGYAGDDVLDGKAGADTMYGGDGKDTYYVDNTGDVVIERAGEGRDLVVSTVSFTLGANVDDLTLTGTSAINGVGNDLANTLVGNAADNVLNGGGRTDKLYGDAGADTLIGGSGDDRLTGGAGGDIFVVTVGGGNDIVTDFTVGTDRIDVTAYGAYQSVSQSGSNTVITFETGVTETLLNVTASALTGDSYIGLSAPPPPTPSGQTINGTDASETLLGGAGDDTIHGFGGNDRLDGKAGADMLYGGTGDDTYLVDNAGDQTIENAGEGGDKVLSSVTWTLDPNLENLFLTGSAAINGTGNAVANQLFGNAAANTLWGLAGNDRLDGGAGADTLYGGAGNDTYFVDNVADHVIENANEGGDKVMSSVSWTLSANVENLTLTGSASINGVGNALSNVINGNAAANTLMGGDGSDHLYGYEGNDVLYGDAGADALSGGAGADTFVFQTLSDSLVAGPDSIIDFDASQDHIDLSAIDANTAVTGDQAFAFVGAFDHHAGEAVLAYDSVHDQTTLTLDVNGDGVADFSLLINGHPLGDSGFIL